MSLQKLQDTPSYKQLKEKLAEMPKRQTRLFDNLPLWTLSVPKNPYAEEYMLALHNLTHLISENDADRVLKSAKQAKSNPVDYLNFVRGQILDGRSLEDILGNNS